MRLQKDLDSKLLILQRLRESLHFDRRQNFSSSITNAKIKCTRKRLILDKYGYGARNERGERPIDICFRIQTFNN